MIPSPPIIFLDLDDVLVTSLQYSSYQVIQTFKQGDIDGWPELWQNLIQTEARDNLRKLHEEFRPQYVISSSWSKYLAREQMNAIFIRTGLNFVADNLHDQWTTPKTEFSGRLDEIEDWLRTYAADFQRMLVLDDHESGWTLQDSWLEDRRGVVLCEKLQGFNASKLMLAQHLLREQGMQGISARWI